MVVALAHETGQNMTPVDSARLKRILMHWVGFDSDCGYVAVLPQPQTNVLFAGSLSAGLIDADPTGLCASATIRAVSMRGQF